MRALSARLSSGKTACQHLAATQRAAPDIGIDVFGLGEAKFLGHFADRLVGQLGALLGEGLFQDLLPEPHMLVALGMTQIAADFGARPAGHHELLPQRRRRGILGGDDLHLVAIVERVWSGTWPPLTLAPTAVLPRSVCTA